MKNSTTLIATIGLFLFILSGFSPNLNTNIQVRWELLGSRQVKFNLDRDEIIVTGQEGTFKSLQVRVKKSAINMHKMVIHFRDGSEQNVELKDNFRAGSESRVIDLDGNNRVIQKVVFWYDTKNYKNRRAIVELWGRH